MKNTKIAMQDHLVAFIDVLGFGSQVLAIKDEAALKTVCATLTAVQAAFYLPNANKVRSKQNLTNTEWGMRTLALSDSVVIAISPICPAIRHMGKNDFWGYSIYGLAQAQYDCILKHGIFLRGGFAVGPFLFDKDLLVSPAQVEAYYIESKDAQVPVIALSHKTYVWIQQNSTGPTGVENWQEKYFRVLRQRAFDPPIYFLDYLRVAIDDAAEDPVPLVRRHKELIQRALASSQAKDKYQWLAKYHNETIEKCCPSATSQRIDI
jgi:hypothetical protein